MVVADSGKTKGKDKERKASLSQGERGRGPGLWDGGRQKPLRTALLGALVGHVQPPTAHATLRRPVGAWAGQGTATMATSPSPAGVTAGVAAGSQEQLYPSSSGAAPAATAPSGQSSGRGTSATARP